MHRIRAAFASLLAVPFFLALSACQMDPEPVVHAKTFFGKIDSAKFDEAWEMLVDEDKLVMDKASFIAAMIDSQQLPGFDSIYDWSVIRQNGDTAEVGTARLAPDWTRLDGIKSRLDRRGQLENLRQNGNLPRRIDSSRKILVVKTPAGPRFHVGLASLKNFIAARDSINESLASKVKLKFTDAIVENNFQAFFHVTGKVTNESDLDLAPVVFQVYLRGKLAGTVTLKGQDKVPAKGVHSGEMTAYYENDLNPQKFGTSWDRGAVKLSVSALRGVVVSARAADRRDVERMALRAVGGIAPPVLY